MTEGEQKAEKYYREFVGKYYNGRVVGNIVYVEFPNRGSRESTLNELQHFAPVETGYPESLIEVRETIADQVAIEFYDE